MTEMTLSLIDQRRMAGENQPVDDLTLAFRGVLMRFHMRGVSGVSLQRLRDRYLPAGSSLGEEGAGASEGADEFDDLVTLLLEHRSDQSEVTEWLACAIATACFGNDHLWQDMNLPSRTALSELLRLHFAALYEKNEGNMKWKKFLYKQLCERANVNLCKAPSCNVCSDYFNCFGPEEGEVALPQCCG